MAAGAQRLHSRDCIAPPVQMTFHRVSYADTADQECRKADDREELRETLDIALELRRCIAAAADVPPSFRQLRVRLRRNHFRIGICSVIARQLEAILPAHETAGL